MRWTTMDPLCEKYYNISPYVYCNSNPINLVDPDGMQWYSYTDEEGNLKYVYCEGEMSEEEKARYQNLTYLGYTYLDRDNNTYYSLFGMTKEWTDSDGNYGEGQIYNKIDKLIIMTATNNSDYETGQRNRVSMYIQGMPMGQNYNINYDGKTFSTIQADGSKGIDGNCYWNVPPENAKALINYYPNKESDNRAYDKQNSGYWLRAHNPDTGVRNGFQLLQLRFSQQNGRNFLNSWNNIFRGHPNNH